MNQRQKIKITYYYRKPIMPPYSIERAFADIRSHMPTDIDCRSALSPFVSRGFWKRFLNMARAVLEQGDVNHITGDVHYLVLLLRKKRSVLTIHDCVTLERLRGIKKLVLLMFWYRLPVRRCGVVTVISESTKKELLRYVHHDPDKIRVIYNCVSEAFRPLPKAFNAEKPVVLQVGTSESKNLIRVVEALEGIACHLRIIGRLNNSQLAALSRHHVEYSAVAGISDAEIVNEYHQADMVVFVSTYEGFGLPIIEANAVGRPVVTSNILSMPEVAGEAACLVDPFSISEIREAIQHIIADARYREQLTRCGFKNVERFNASLIAGQYASLYREIYEDASR